MAMTSRERVRMALSHRKPDRVPAAFEAVDTVKNKIKEHYGFHSDDQIYEKFRIDIDGCGPDYIGPELKEYVNESGETVRQTYWGSEQTEHVTSVDVYSTTSYYPLNYVTTPEEAMTAKFPDPDWFDYDSLRRKCLNHPDMAIILGDPGPFQTFTTCMLEMEKLFVLMVESPEVAQTLFDRMVDFEIEYYTRCFEACGGMIDILRPHDDYGTQISLLFSKSMWKKFFERNTRRLVDLAHHYGAFYQQHSCGAIAPLIPNFIDCGVDSLEPLQKVPGLYPEELAEKYLGKIAFHGGIDTQTLLPYGTPEQVEAEAEKYIRLLGQNGGYILMSSQAFEGDVPLENIEAVYRANRVI